MAITFQEQIKKQRNFILIFVILILVIVLVLWQGFRTEEQPSEILISRLLKKIEINLEIFQNPLLQQMQLIDKTPAFEGVLGRENPFIPF